MHLLFVIFQYYIKELFTQHVEKNRWGKHNLFLILNRDMARKLQFTGARDYFGFVYV